MICCRLKIPFTGLADRSEYSLSPKDDSETDLYGHFGEAFPIRELTRRMIVSSSNLASNLLIEKVGAGMYHPLHAGPRYQ